ncbi:WD40/YVTN/BNR-like repeat-containing protein [Salinicola peritrichatus]|uniref:WD40/YVTN/BNR-like repeat-containing protein n=1 Tax=Salinicola peritrichatus TaxID=1267424 RepID=UPI000DA10CE4|nr:glycosyl hydrolase [Salinicola peritrichatus]
MKRFLLGMQSGLIVADESETGWLSSRRLEGMQPTAIAVDPGKPGRLYCATYNRGLWRSEDHGDHWRPIGGPLPYHEPHNGPEIPLLEMTSVAIAPSPNSKQWHDLYVGTEPSRLFHSDDGGDHWQELTGIQSMPSKAQWQFPPRPYTHHVRWINSSPEDSACLYVSIEFGALLRSVDHGSTWHDRTADSPKDAHVLLSHPRAPGRLYAACGDGYMEQGYSFGDSRDGGDSWHYTSAGLEEEPYLYGLAVNPADPDDIRVAAASSPRTAHGRLGSASVYCNVEQGWQRDSDGLPIEDSFIAVLAADPQQPGTFYALNNHGVFCQRGREETWQRIPLDWDDAYLDEHPMCLAVLDR